MEHADSIIARAGTRNVAGASAAGAAAAAASALVEQSWSIGISLGLRFTRIQSPFLPVLPN